jgi:hypothetical protein
MFKLNGVDIYLRSETTPDLPKEHGKLKLVLISNRGTRVWPPPAPPIQLCDWPRSRWESDDEVTDQDIDELAAFLTKEGFYWTKLQKLYTLNGERQYSQPY